MNDLRLVTYCDEYPCQHIEALAARYPALLADGRRLKSLGMETWINEQEERRRSGFCYADIRCPPDAASQIRSTRKTK